MPKAKPKNLDKPWVSSFIKVMSSLNTWVYKASGGKIAGKLSSGVPFMLLTTIGRKSGKPRTKPLVYLRDGENIVCVASQGGRATNPLWYSNLVANPDCTVQIGNDVEKRRARTASTAEKERLWPLLVQMYPDYDNYQSWTDREIPVVILERA
jgi:deazaflavin-dependent oxidoreductase (nitroreductase family)